ncbi:hypothetical protein [Tsukamurella soli]|uniref:Uncharacterized protein n=1 Tax=Tsukamurella soli TaxID=644556 RepID=A0ABP8JZG0_9ACTN
MNEHVTESAGVTAILDAIATLTGEQTARADRTDDAGPQVRTTAVALFTALYGTRDLVALKKAIAEAIAPLELGGTSSEHLSVLAEDAALAALLRQQDAGQDVVGALTTPWRRVLG